MDPSIFAPINNAVWSGIGSLLGGGSKVPSIADQARDASFASIDGKVKAAAKHGISKLYALGAPTVSPGAVPVGDPGLGEVISNMGQDLSRAVAARQTEPERLLQQLTLEKAGLENEFLRSQIASINARTRQQAMTSMPADPHAQKIVPPQRTSGVNINSKISTNPNFDDAQVYEDRYGEVGGSAIGLVNIPADLWQTAKDWWKNPATWRDWPF